MGCPSAPEAPTPNPDPVDTTVIDPIENPVEFSPISTKGFKGVAPKENSYFDLPELSRIPEDAVIVTPGTVNIINNPQHNYFVLVPGDYGHFQLNREGHPAKPVVIRADPSLGLPWEDELTVRFNSIYIIGEYITISGIEIDGEGRNDMKAKQQNRVVASNRHTYATSVVFNECWIHDLIGFGLKFFAEYSGAQRCVINDKGPGGFDQGGIGFYTIDGKPAWGNRIIGCEIFNWTDAVGVPVTPRGDSVDGSFVPDLLIEDCDFYITEDLYIQKETGEWACAEDGVDLKTGGTEENPAIMRNCRLWGFRPTDQDCGGSGSSGKCITAHLAARNWIIEDNVFFNSNEGIYITDESKPGAKTENIVVRNNLLFNMVQAVPCEIRRGEVQYNPDGTCKENVHSGSAFRSTGDARIYGNTVVDAVRFNSIRPNPNSVYLDNLFCTKHECMDTEYTDYTFTIKKLTDPTEVTVRVPVVR
jgi:hypothetical protein